MDTAKSGLLFRMMGLFGWYQSTPVNLTDEESKKPQLGGAGADEGSSFSRNQAATNPEGRYQDMLAMSESELVGPILEVYAEEACQPDINKGRALWYECDDSTVEDELNKMLDRINSEEHLPSIVIGAAGTGNEFRRILYNDQGVQQLVGVPASTSSQMPVRRIWDKTTRRLLGFKWEGQKPREEDVLYERDKEVFAPWTFIHFRRLFHSQTEYGVAILDRLYPLWRKLEQSIDQMVLYRRHTMPTRHAVMVDTKDQDIVDAMESIHIFAHMMRQQHVMLSGGMESRYNPPSLESMLFLPIRGTDDKTTIETMQGDKDVPDVPDIEQLLKQLYGGARVPKTYMGQDDEGGGLAQASLVSQDIRFARVVRNIRRILVSGFYRLAQIHLALTGKDPAQFNIKVKMSRISTIEEEVNVAILEKQANLARTIADLCQQLEIPNREIIDLVFREYLSVPRYFIDIAKLGASVARALGGPADAEGGMGGGGGGMGGGGMGGLDALDFGEEGGDEGDIGGLGDDEELAPDAGAPPEKQVASGRSRSSNLFENRRRTGPKQRSKMAAIIRSMETNKGMALDTKKTTVRECLSRRIANEIRSIGELHTSRRSSLIEDYTGASLETESMPVLKDVGKSTMLHESFKGSVKEDVVFEDLVVESAESAHPMVKMRRGLAARKETS